MESTNFHSFLAFLADSSPSHLSIPISFTDNCDFFCIQCAMQYHLPKPIVFWPDLLRTLPTKFASGRVTQIRLSRTDRQKPSKKNQYVYPLRHPSLSQPYTHQPRWPVPSKLPVSPPVARPPASSSPPRRRASLPPPPAASRSPTGTAPVPSRFVRSASTKSPPSS